MVKTNWTTASRLRGRGREVRKGRTEQRKWSGAEKWEVSMESQSGCPERERR